ncbi:MAG: hypothetical protein R3A47_10720 [Polyangiales bacterium]
MDERVKEIHRVLAEETVNVARYRDELASMRGETEEVIGGGDTPTSTISGTVFTISFFKQKWRNDLLGGA